MRADLSRFLAGIADRGRQLLRMGKAPWTKGLTPLAEALLSHKGEASGVALARITLDSYASSQENERRDFLLSLLTHFGTDNSKLTAAIQRYSFKPDEPRAQEVLRAAEPRRQELLRRLNHAPGGTWGLIKMREDLLRALPQHPELKVVDQDFLHLFSSWFNRGFLELRRIDWNTPASILEKIITYEAVHKISDWDELKRRLAPPDRRCFAFFHPQLSGVPLIFVEVALTATIPNSIGAVLSSGRELVDANSASTAVFYSISNTQRALAGVSFGNFLIKQVVDDLRRELPKLKTFVTLSPVPGFSRWLDIELVKDASPITTSGDGPVLKSLLRSEWIGKPDMEQRLQAPLLRAAACYFLSAKTKDGYPVDPVARFHLGNGARLERLNFLGDTSANGISQSHGLMVNYLYDPNLVEKNHETYADKGEIVAAAAIKKACSAGRVHQH